MLKNSSQQIWWVLAVCEALQMGRYVEVRKKAPLAAWHAAAAAAQSSAKPWGCRASCGAKRQLSRRGTGCCLQRSRSVLQPAKSGEWQHAPWERARKLLRVTSRRLPREWLGKPTAPESSRCIVGSSRVRAGLGLGGVREELEPSPPGEVVGLGGGTRVQQRDPGTPGCDGACARFGLVPRYEMGRRETGSCRGLSCSGFVKQ